MDKRDRAPRIVKTEDTLLGMALAMLAGARTIETRRNGGTFVLDPLGFAGGPYEMDYTKAAEILRKEGNGILEMVQSNQEDKANV